MICVFFVPGMFGSTVEYVLRAFTNELDNIDAEILSDGSMHSFKTQMHLTDRTNFISFFSQRPESVSVVTPIYPFNNAGLPELLELCNPYISDSDKKLLIYADSIEYAEINMLFQYHKISAGTKISFGLKIFCNDNFENVRQWNSVYTHWDQMQHWELREWISLFYKKQITEWLDAPTQSPGWQLVSTRDLLNDTEQTLEKIIQISGLSKNQKNLTEFASNWRCSQQYVLDEHQLIDRAVSCIITQEDFSWSSLNIIAEAMIQNKLRESGFEILCDGLNKFPTNSIEFHKLLIGNNNA